MLFTILPTLLLLPLSKANTIIVTVTETAKATTTASHPASYTSPRIFEDTVLSFSNDYRTAYNASHLVWNETLAEYAKTWAVGCKWQHSHGPYGENLAFGYPNASSAITAWGTEGLLYNFDKPTGFTEATGHFTQLVWKATTEVGCAAVDCGYEDDAESEDGTFEKAQGWYVVCEYAPAGNVLGNDDEFFRVNVVPTRVGVGVETGSASLTETGGAAKKTDSHSSGGMRIQTSGGVRYRIALAMVIAYLSI